MRDVIRKIVNENSGIKNVELVIKVAQSLIEEDIEFEPRDLIIQIESLVKEGEIVELEFILPDMGYRVKSMYFPKGTKLTPITN
jgi:hypothetical protein